MNESRLVHTLSPRFFVHKQNIIVPRIFSSSLPCAITATNANCCGSDQRKVVHFATKVQQHAKTKTEIASPPSEFIIEVPKQTKVAALVTDEKPSLFFEVISNAWPVSNERVENLSITHKRCQFSNEALSIKPITAGVTDKLLHVATANGALLF